MKKTDPCLLTKIERIHKGSSIRTLDLFAGCGGLSLGFNRVGFKSIGAVEIDPVAVQSYAKNFWRGSDNSIIADHAVSRDITITEPGNLLRELGVFEDVASAVDVIIGGPPCQAFARVGRAKLREVDAHPEAFRLDPRANLYLRYLHYVRQLRPIALLMENVPDAMNHGGQNIAEEMCEVLSELGYVCSYTLLNAAYYGVPQMRERMFLIAYARGLVADIKFPEPTHWLELPKGYEGSRQVALKALGRVGLQHQIWDGDRHYYVKPPMPTRNLRPAVTARDALEDLPPITLHLEGKLRRGARRFVDRAIYSHPVVSGTYPWEMRTWPGFEGSDGVLDHVIRSLPRDYAIFRRMNPGDQYPEAYKHAMALFEEQLEKCALKGELIQPDSVEYLKLLAKTVPPYDPYKFPNKWRKIEADQPTRTLMAHLGKDGYSHIHYDSDQARTISVREAARLQSFPDGFIFEGTMNPAFRQIGNAVPPLMATAIAVKMYETIIGRGSYAKEACS